MTAFSDFPAPAEHALHLAAEQIHAYLAAYASASGVTGRIRFGTPVGAVRRRLDGGRRAVRRGRGVVGTLPAAAASPTPFARLRAASCCTRSTTRAPARSATGARSSTATASAAWRSRPTSRRTSPVTSAFRKPRYVIQKNLGGVSSDWQWYTLFGALERRLLEPAEWAARQRERILRVAGDPAGFGAPEPSEDLRVAGLSLCQDYLEQVRDGSIACRPEIAAVEVDHGHLRGRLVGDRRGDRLRDRLRPRPPLSPARCRGPARRRPGPLPAHLPPRPPRPRRDRPVPRPGPVLPAARAAGALDRRGLERRGRAALRRRDAAGHGPSAAAAGRPQRARPHALRGAGRRARAARRSTRRSS